MFVVQVCQREQATRVQGDGLLARDTGLRKVRGCSGQSLACGVDSDRLAHEAGRDSVGQGDDGGGMGLGRPPGL